MLSVNKFHSRIVLEFYTTELVNELQHSSSFCLIIEVVGQFKQSPVFKKEISNYFVKSTWCIFNCKEHQSTYKYIFKYLLFIILVKSNNFMWQLLHLYSVQYISYILSGVQYCWFHIHIFIYELTLYFQFQTFVVCYLESQFASILELKFCFIFILSVLYQTHTYLSVSDLLNLI